MTEVANRVAVVTGAGSGIGRGLAMALAKEGARVVVADIVEANARTVASEIGRSGGRAVALSCDVSERTSVEALRSETKRAFGPASLLFANAGVTLFKPLTEMSDEEVDWILQVDLLGVFHCLRAFLPDMIVARDGHIMATSSVSGLLCPFLENHAPYVAAKAGVFGLMLSMRREVEKFGIGATVLLPGAVRTGIADSLKARPVRYGGPSEGSVHLPIEKSLLRQRSPEEVADMVLLAVRNNRAVVVTDGTMKDIYKQSTELVLTAFDDVLEFDRARG